MNAASDARTKPATAVGARLASDTVSPVSGSVGSTDTWFTLGREALRSTAASRHHAPLPGPSLCVNMQFDALGNRQAEPSAPVRLDVSTSRHVERQSLSNGKHQ